MHCATVSVSLDAVEAGSDDFWLGSVQTLPPHDPYGAIVGHGQCSDGIGVKGDIFHESVP